MTIALRSMAIYISDILLGEKPWLDMSTVCTFPSPWIPDYATHSNVSHTINITKQDFNFTQYIGVYGHLAFGNISVYKNNSDSELHMKFGRFGHAVLYKDHEHSFEAYYQDLLSYISFGDSSRGPFEVEFSEFVDSMTTVLKINIDMSIKTKFIRDFKLTDIPPDQGNVCTATARASDACHGQWALSSTLFILSVLYGLLS